jgi:DNA-binding NarL/FixJ family response regulator
MSVPAEDTITIVLADDHEVVRSSMRLLLDAEPDLEVVAEAGDVDAALRCVADCKPTVLVLDLNMPGERPSLEALPAVPSATRVVVLTVHEDPEFAHHALGAGAYGYVLKDAAHGELVEAVRRAAAGETYVNPRLA